MHLDPAYIDVHQRPAIFDYSKKIGEKNMRYDEEALREYKES